MSGPIQVLCRCALHSQDMAFETGQAERYSRPDEGRGPQDVAAFREWIDRHWQNAASNLLYLARTFDAANDESEPEAA